MFNRHRILYRYVTRENLKIFGLTLSSLVLIYVVVLFLQKMNVFIKYQATPDLIFKYLFYKMPEVIFQWTLPYAILLATLLTLSILSQHSEITALKAGGVSLYRITLPLFCIALLMSFFSFLGNEYLVPFTNQKVRNILDVQVRKERPSSFFRNNKIWYRGDHQIFNIQLLDPKKKILKGFTLYQFDDSFRCIERIDAREARFINGSWRFYSGALRNFLGNESIHVTPFDEMEFPLKENWESFLKTARASEEMSYTALWSYVQKIRSSGYDATRYLVDLHAKLSHPLLSLIMVLIGIPFALKTSRSGGVAFSIGISVLVGFVYGVVYYVSLSIGKSGVLPPFVAAWTPTVLFGLGGIFTLMSVRQ